MDIEEERYLREHADANCFDWGWISTTKLSKDFILEFKDRLHPQYINDFKQKWIRIDEIIQRFGSKFYMDNFDNYGYIDRW